MASENSSNSFRSGGFRSGAGMGDVIKYKTQLNKQNAATENANYKRNRADATANRLADEKQHIRTSNFEDQRSRRNQLYQSKVDKIKANEAFMDRGRMGANPLSREQQFQQEMSETKRRDKYNRDQETIYGRNSGGNSNARNSDAVAAYTSAIKNNVMRAYNVAGMSQGAREKYFAQQAKTQANLAKDGILNNQSQGLGNRPGVPNRLGTTTAYLR
jgi:hypothetical protein